MYFNQKKGFYKQGFTLIELMVTITIAGILASIAIPSFNQSIRNSRLTTQANTLVGALNFARSEAIKRGQAVTVRQTSATSGTWEDGWTVFTDLDGNGINENNGVLDDDIVLRVYKALPSGFTLRSTNNTKRVTYRTSGISGMVSFVLCDNSDGNATPEANTARVIIINRVGRVRMGADANNDGIPEKLLGNNEVNITSCETSPFTS